MTASEARLARDRSGASLPNGPPEPKAADAIAARRTGKRPQRGEAGTGQERASRPTGPSERAAAPALAGVQAGPPGPSRARQEAHVTSQPGDGLDRGMWRRFGARTQSMPWQRATAAPCFALPVARPAPAESCLDFTNPQRSRVALGFGRCTEGAATRFRGSRACCPNRCLQQGHDGRRPPERPGSAAGRFPAVPGAATIFSIACP